jgi:ABC transporter substrate binding protein
LVASVAWPLATAVAKRTQRLHGVWDDSLEKLGWIDGRTVTIDYRCGSRGQERTQVNITELMGTSVAVLAVMKIASSIPIVGNAMTDPVGMGLAKSEAHPGGNVTGTVMVLSGLAGKQLEIGGEIRKAFPLAVRGEVVDGDRLPIDISQITESLEERLKSCRFQRAWIKRKETKPRVFFR